MSLSQKFDRRNLLAIKNIFPSLVFKGGSMLIQIILVPLSISVLGTKDYGIWLTIYSVINWLTFFDIGIGNGLKNELTKTFSKKQTLKSRKLISTGYFVISVIFILGCCSVLILNNSIDFFSYLTLGNKPLQIKTVFNVLIVSFGLQSVLSIINSIFAAKQMIGWTTSFFFVINLITLIGIYFLEEISTNTAGNFLAYALIVSFIPPALYLIVNLMFFSFNRQIFPHRKFVKVLYIKRILSLGVKFLFLQIAAIILYQTTIIFISYFLSPEAVTEYNISYRYFFVCYTLFNIIINPFWTLFADAKTSNDKKWINKTIINLIYIWAFISILIVAQFFFAHKLIPIWIGNSNLEISRELYLVNSLYFIFLSWNLIFLYLFNGLGVLNFLMIIFTIIIILLPILIWILNSLEMLSLSTIILANVLCQAIIAVSLPLFYIKKVKYLNIF